MWRAIAAFEKRSSRESGSCVGLEIAVARFAMESGRAVSDRHRIPSLDGLRAISIVMVFIAHLAGTARFPLSAGTGNFLGLGELGVHVFFVISGYLITRLLLDELNTHGRVNLAAFYLRRTLRIFPPYYVYLAVVFVSGSLSVLQLAPHDIAHGLTYTSNYYPERSWFLGHTWSLSVEEQFYLLWPALLMLAGRRRAILIAAWTVVLVPLVRLGSWELMRWASDGIGHRFETVADAIAVGCVLAGIRPWLHRSAVYMRALASPWFVAVPLIVVAANLLHDHPVAYFLGGLFLTNVGAAACLDRCVTFASGRVGRFLNARPMVFVGSISYSLYLWQQLFLNRSSANAMSTFPLNLALAVCAALASYHVVERPSLQLRRWIESRRDDERHVVVTRSNRKIFAPFKVRCASGAVAKIGQQAARGGRGLRVR
jgi:peptidoglycan/LPS O-acetylase OafA/YrhL